MNAPSMANASDGDPLQNGKSYYMKGNGKNITTRADWGTDWKRWDFVKAFDHYNTINETAKPVTLEHDSSNNCWKMKMSNSTWSGYEYIIRSSNNNLYLDTKIEATCWKIDKDKEGYGTRIFESQSSQYWKVNGSSLSNWIISSTIEADYFVFTPVS
ncbi:hypothetical protein FC697_26765 [Bacillus wiedmannii]|uniref:hypothetical protein n=1 Tax=Bacillus wiedmannii TaxID=1890302 RepID=UPI0010BDC730|nr:hypothetical protein [Bacillus wiedmannii]TKH10319.1 hypothetical protein FC697_26765 [Bacillus wiedmannii]